MTLEELNAVQGRAWDDVDVSLVHFNAMTIQYLTDNVVCSTELACFLRHPSVGCEYSPAFHKADSNFEQRRAYFHHFKTWI